MKYKKITFACVLLGLSLYAGVCAATVREVADEAPASKQTIIADKKDKKLLNKKQRAVQITQEKDKIVVSTKPVAKPPAGTINVPAAPRPSLLQEKDGKFFYDSKIEGEVLGEAVDPFMEIKVLPDGCLLYSMDVLVLERV